MDDFTRRELLRTAAVVGAVTVAGVSTARAAEPLKKFSFDEAEPAKSCRLLPRTVDDMKAVAKVIPGIVNNTFFLFVAGKKPYINMKVMLSPLVYVRKPEYWGIEVLGCVNGIVLPTIGPYQEMIPLDGIIGTRGIEVIWAGGETEKFDVASKA